MARTRVRIFLHFVWTTKMREPILRGKVEHFVHRRFRQIAGDYDVDFLAGNSAWNHTHLLIKAHTSLVIKALVREWKSRTTQEWNARRHRDAPILEWQRGAGIFSVSPHEVDRLVRYIEKQKYHHRHQSTIHRYEREFGWLSREKRTKP